MTIIKIILAWLIFVQASCTDVDKKGNKSFVHNNLDSCKTILNSFNYPDDLNRLESLNYICQDTFFHVSILKKELNLTPLFSDRNYLLLNYDFRTKLLCDKRDRLFFCFKRIGDSEDFNRKSVYSIYILDATGMPLYLIEQHPFENETSISKLYYDNKHSQLYGYLVKRKEDTQPVISEINYADIIRISKELLNEQYFLTNKFISFETSHFKTTPLWTDN